MVGCVLSQLKPSELYILSFEKVLSLRPRPLSKLRMYSSSGFILYATGYTMLCVHSSIQLNLFINPY